MPRSSGQCCMFMIHIISNKCCTLCKAVLNDVLRPCTHASCKDTQELCICAQKGLCDQILLYRQSNIMLLCLHVTVTMASARNLLAQNKYLEANVDCRDQGGGCRWPCRCQGPSPISHPRPGPCCLLRAQDDVSCCMTAVCHHCPACPP